MTVHECAHLRMCQVRLCVLCVCVSVIKHVLLTVHVMMCMHGYMRWIHCTPYLQIGG